MKRLPTPRHTATLDENPRLAAPLTRGNMEGDWAGTELVSPVMCRDTNKRDVYCTQEIVKALAVLNTRGAEVNASTVLHVHIGKEVKRFSIETVRSLLVFAVAFEEEINTCYPQRRTGSNSYNQGQRYTLFTAEEGRSHGYLGETASRNLRKEEIALLILGNTVQALLDAVTWKRAMATDAWGDTKNQLLGLDNRAIACNLTNLSTADPNHHWSSKSTLRETVKFRQHDGRLSVNRMVVAWVKFGLTLMAFCNGASVKVMQPYILDELKQREQGGKKQIWDFMEGMDK